MRTSFLHSDAYSTINSTINCYRAFEILCRFAAVSKLLHGEDWDWDWEGLDPTEQLHDARQRTIHAEKLMKELDELLAEPPKTDV